MASEHAQTYFQGRARGRQFPEWQAQGKKERRDMADEGMTESEFDAKIEATVERGLERHLPPLLARLQHSRHTTEPGADATGGTGELQLCSDSPA